MSKRQPQTPSDQTWIKIKQLEISVQTSMNGGVMVKASQMKFNFLTPSLSLVLTLKKNSEKGV